jgi:hypothetical protein
VSLLSPGTCQTRIKNLVVLTNSLKKRVERLVLKLEESIEFSKDEGNVMEVLDHALKYCTANAGDMREPRRGKTQRRGCIERLLEFLQLDQFTKLVDSIKSPVLKNRLVLVAVVLTLSRLYLDELHGRIMTLLDNSLLPSDETSALSEAEFTIIKLQVKRLVGYGLLFKLIERASSRAVGDEDESSLDLKFARSLRLRSFGFAELSF